MSIIINNLEEYYKKYLSENELYYIHKGELGEGIYDLKNKKALIIEDDKLTYYEIEKNLAYERKKFYNTEMYKAIIYLKGEIDEL